MQASRWNRLRQTAPKNLRAELIAKFRHERLRKKSFNICAGLVLDLAWAVILPSVIGIALAVTAVLILKNVDGSGAWITDNIYSPQVTAALGTLIAFLVALRLGSNLTRNANLINHFGNLCGACVNMAVWSRCLVTSADFAFNTYLDHRGQQYRQTELGLLLASVPYVVKFHYRGKKIDVSKLPLAVEDKLLGRIQELTNPRDGLVPVGHFLALVMMLGEMFDNFEAKSQIKPAELSALLGHLNALTGQEGAIGGMSEYAPPMILDILLYVVFLMYYVLMIFSDLGPNAEWNSLWIVAVLIVANFGVFSVSNRYSNPFHIRSGRSTQRSFISEGAQGTEKAIEGVFTRPGRLSDIVNPNVPITMPDSRGSLSKLLRMNSNGLPMNV